MLRLNNRQTQLFINNELIIEDTTFLDEPDKLLVALLEMLKCHKECAVAAFANDFEEKLIIFVSNPWNECVYVLDRVDNDKPDIKCFNVSIKELAKSIINNTDILEIIEDIRKRGKEEIASRLENNLNELKENINNDTIYSANNKL